MFTKHDICTKFVQEKDSRRVPQDRIVLEIELQGWMPCSFMPGEVEKAEF